MEKSGNCERTAALGGFGMGAQSGSPIIGGIGGALSGLAISPIGAVVGGVGGILGGVFGPSKRKQQARVEEAAADLGRSAGGDQDG